MVAVLLPTPSVALAVSGRIVENVGIRRLVPLKKTAGLNLHDSTNKLRLGWSSKRVTYKDYQGAGYTVYGYFFGTKSSTTHKYPLEMYSKASSRHVFTFIVYSSALVTSNGTHVGTTEVALASRYGSRVKRYTTPTYTYYRMHIHTGGKTQFTEFWCKSGKVHHVVIGRY
jgi:hypothetical protein